MCKVLAKLLLTSDIALKEQEKEMRIKGGEKGNGSEVSVMWTAARPKPELSLDGDEANGVCQRTSLSGLTCAL